MGGDSWAEICWPRSGWRMRAPGLPVAETVGAMLTTLLAALTLAVHESLMAQGVSADDGHWIVFDIGWRSMNRCPRCRLC
jgi:hypothetical protein